MDPVEYNAKLDEVHKKIAWRYAKIRESHKEIGLLLKLQAKIIKEYEGTKPDTTSETPKETNRGKW